MTLCTECNAKIPTMARRLMRANSELHQLGLEYHDTLSYSLNATERILSKHGFAGIACTVVPATGHDGRIHEPVGENKWLSLSWHRMDSGRYEVVAYVN